MIFKILRTNFILLLDNTKVLCYNMPIIYKDCDEEGCFTESAESVRLV